MINVEHQLIGLSQGWDLTLTSHEVGPGAVIWHLTITRIDGDGEFLSHTYEGERLARVVSAAWAGEPDGVVS